MLKARRGSTAQLVMGWIVWPTHPGPEMSPQHSRSGVRMRSASIAGRMPGASRMGSGTSGLSTDPTGWVAAEAHLLDAFPQAVEQ